MLTGFARTHTVRRITVCVNVHTKRAKESRVRRFHCEGEKERERESHAKMSRNFTVELAGEIESQSKRKLHTKSRKWENEKTASIKLKAHVLVRKAGREPERES